ncbi:thioredoxin domain-containing protein [Streptomyces sp. NPDC007851]|uniref:thioredoxin domain-containing protein n=1 Tax=Streptomyces sp. NPDC007851 TaxID=3155008 RepID=UPI0033C4B1D2
MTLTAAPYASASSAAPRPAAQGAAFGATQQAKAPIAATSGRAVINVTSAEQFNTLLQDNPKVIVDFMAVWCGPCRLIQPRFEGLSTEPEYSAVKFAVIDVDQVPDVSEKAGIRAMPTFQTYLNGEKKGELLGADPNKLRRILGELAAV